MVSRPIKQVCEYGPPADEAILRHWLNAGQKACARGLRLGAHPARPTSAPRKSAALCRDATIRNAPMPSETDNVMDVLVTAINRNVLGKHTDVYDVLTAAQMVAS